jgi:hypothetical protein
VGVSTFPAAITLAAAGLPSGATATFTPSNIAEGAAATNVTLSIQTSSASASLRRDGAPAVLAFCVLFVPLAGLGRWKRSRHAGFGHTRWMLLLVLLVASLGIGACGGGSGSSGGGPSPQSYTVTVTASSGAVQQSTAVTLTVQ